MVHAGRASAAVGVLSDTHGILPRAVAGIFGGVDLIVHAGDVGSERILYELAAVAPVLAVVGNTDHPFATWPLGRRAYTTVAGVHIAVTHVSHRGHRLKPPAVLVTGHTHRPEVCRRGGILYVNPGSTSYSRTADERGSVAFVRIDSGDVDAEIVPLPMERPQE